MFKRRGLKRVIVVCCLTSMILAFVTACSPNDVAIPPDDAVVQDIAIPPDDAIVASDFSEEEEGNDNSLSESEHLFIKLDYDVDRRLYSPDKQNYLTFRYGEFSAGYPDILVYLNDSSECLAQLQYDWHVFEDYKYVSFWLDNERIFLDGRRIYNIASGAMQVISMPEQLNDYPNRSIYAVPSPDREQIAYIWLEEHEENKYYQDVYIYDIETQTWANPYTHYQSHWGTEPFFSLVWASDDYIYFNELYLYFDELSRYSDEHFVYPSGQERNVIRLDPETGESETFLAAAYFGLVSPSQNYAFFFYDDLESDSVIWDFEKETPVFSVVTDVALSRDWSDTGNEIAYLDPRTQEFVIYSLSDQRDKLRVEVGARIENAQTLDIVFIKDRFYLIVDYFLPETKTVYMIDFAV